MALRSLSAYGNVVYTYLAKLLKNFLRSVIFFLSFSYFFFFFWQINVELLLNDYPVVHVFHTTLNKKI